VFGKAGILATGRSSAAKLTVGGSDNEESTIRGEDRALWIRRKKI